MKRSMVVCIVILLSILATSQSWAQNPSDELPFHIYLPIAGKSMPGIPPSPGPGPGPGPGPQDCASIAEAAAEALAEQMQEALTYNIIENIKKQIAGESYVVILEPKSWGRINVTRARPTEFLKVQFVIPKHDIWQLYWQYEPKIDIAKALLAGTKGLNREDLMVTEYTINFTFGIGSGWIETADQAVATTSNQQVDIPNKILSANINATAGAMNLAQGGETPMSTRLNTYIKGGIGILELKVSGSYDFYLKQEHCPQESLPTITVASSLKLDLIEPSKIPIQVHAVYPWGEVTVACDPFEYGLNEFRVTTEYPVPFGSARFIFEGRPPTGPVEREPDMPPRISMLRGEYEGTDLLGAFWGGECMIEGACTITYVLVDINWNNNILPGWTQYYPLGKTATCVF